MKANSVGLETDVYLSQEQIKSLENSVIRGLLKFREVNDNEIRREIPFEISHDKSQEESLKVRIEPSQTYFGDAEKVTYIINDYLYYQLVTTGSCGDRFLVSGKLLIFAK
ncbi:Uncharacterised protein [uncultured archaeon]|nr:Uncharacterised protein [uncultured archaeon]